MLLDLLKKADCNAKNTDTGGKVPSITGSATTAAVNAVEKKIPQVSDLVKKTDYDKKMSDIETKYFTASDYDKFMDKIFDAKLKIKRIS